MTDSASFDCILSVEGPCCTPTSKIFMMRELGVCKATERCMCFNRTTVALFLRFLLELFFGNSLVNIIEWNHTALNCDCSGFSVVGKCHCYQLILRITAHYLIWIFLLILQRTDQVMFCNVVSLFLGSRSQFNENDSTLSTVEGAVNRVCCAPLFHGNKSQDPTTLKERTILRNPRLTSMMGCL